MWTEIQDGNLIAREMFRRHYSYRRSRDQMSFIPSRERNRNLFIGPGQKMALLSPDGSAMFVWRKFISMDRQVGVNCAVFRNEGKGRASVLIAEADVLAWLRWPGERLYTYVDRSKVRSRNPGYCFIMAGYRKCGVTKSGLLIFEHLPEETE
jgi:hypothetical protein